MKIHVLPIALLLPPILMAVMGIVILVNQPKTELKNETVILAPTPSIKPTTIPIISIPVGWKTYKSNQFGFEITYPPEYKALDNEDSLYGWKNGVVIFYKGGQSYDLVVQVWDKESDYELQYPNEDRLTVKNAGEKFITLFNQNKVAEVDQIIETFRLSAD